MSAEDDAFWRVREQMVRLDERVTSLKETKLGPEALTALRDFINAGDTRVETSAGLMIERAISNLQTNMRNENRNNLQEVKADLMAKIDSKLDDAVGKMPDIVGSALDSRFPEQRAGFLSHPVTRYGGGALGGGGIVIVILQSLGLIQW